MGKEETEEQKGPRGDSTADSDSALPLPLQMRRDNEGHKASFPPCPSSGSTEHGPQGPMGRTDTEKQVEPLRKSTALSDSVLPKDITNKGPKGQTDNEGPQGLQGNEGPKGPIAPLNKKRFKLGPRTLRGAMPSGGWQSRPPKGFACGCLLGGARQNNHVGMRAPGPTLYGPSEP